MLLSGIYAKVFLTTNPVNGELADADSTPTVTVYKNGVSDDMAADMTVSNITTGQYKIVSANSFSTNEFTAGDKVDVVITAIVAGVTGKMVHSFTIDGENLSASEIRDAIGLAEADLDTQLSSVAQAGEAATAVGTLNDISAADVITALKSATGFTAGNTFTFAEVMKILLSFATGNCQLKSGTTDTYEFLDADDGSTVIMEMQISKNTPYKTITIV